MLAMSVHALRLKLLELTSSSLDLFSLHTNQPGNSSLAILEVFFERQSYYCKSYEFCYPSWFFPKRSKERGIQQTQACQIVALASLAAHFKNLIA